jgi:hypothetical protein
MTLPKPMLAPNGEPDLNALRYPVFASHKLDGVRFLIFDGKMYSRNMEPLHSAVTKRFQPVIDWAQKSGVCLDGEIWRPGTPFNTIVSWMADPEKCHFLWLYVFDILAIEEWYAAKPWTPFRDRVRDYTDWREKWDADKRFLKSVVQYECKDFMSCYELCYYCWREGAAHKFFGPHNERDLWEVKKEPNQRTVHPTQKPVELAVKALMLSSKQGENILELFGGSGSTLIACEQTGRKCFAMEIDEAFCDVIVERWSKFTGKEPIHIQRIPADGENDEN